MRLGSARRGGLLRNTWAAGQRGPLVVAAEARVPPGCLAPDAAAKRPPLPAHGTRCGHAPELRYINPLSAFAACVARSNSGDGKIPNAIVATANATATNTTSG